EEAARGRRRARRSPRPPACRPRRPAGCTRCTSAAPRGGRGTASRPGSREYQARLTTGPAGLAPQALQLVAREIGLVGARVARDHPSVVGAGGRLVAALLGQEAQLV